MKVPYYALVGRNREIDYAGDSDLAGLCSPALVTPVSFLFHHTALLADPPQSELLVRLLTGKSSITEARYLLVAAFSPLFRAAEIYIRTQNHIGRWSVNRVERATMPGDVVLQGDEARMFLPVYRSIGYKVKSILTLVSEGRFELAP